MAAQPQQFRCGEPSGDVMFYSREHKKLMLFCFGLPLILPLREIRTFTANITCPGVLLPVELLRAGLRQLRRLVGQRFASQSLA